MVTLHQDRDTLLDIIVDVFKKLVSDHPEIETVSAVGSYSDSIASEDEKDKGAWSFSIRLKEVTDKKGAQVVLEFRGDSMFPWSEVEVFTDNYFGLPHQRLRDGKLCLDQEKIIDADLNKVEVAYQQAREWLDAAHNDLLAKAGEPYEFPDFEHGEPTRSKKRCRLLFDEDGRGFEFIRHIECAQRVGVAELVFSDKNYREAYLQKLRVGEGECQFANFNWPVAKRDGIIRCVPFVVFDDIDVINHRPPITWGELLDKIRKERGVAEKLLTDQWKKLKDETGFLLVGWLIPVRYGAQVSQLVWKLLTFATREWERNQVKRRTPNCNERRLRAGDWSNSEIMDKGACVAWCVANNISQSERLIRWRLAAQLRDKKICIAGCGALGSQVAELLVRGGCNRIVLVDSECFEYGNLSRHTLTSMSVGKNKARMLAFRLRLIIPSDDIEVHECGLPGNGSKNCQRARDAVAGCDVVVDCTGDVNGGIWLSQLTGNNKPIRAVRAFMSGEAEFLSLCLTGKNKTLRRVEQSLSEAMKQALNWDGMDWDRYKAKDELMVRGAGCWSATFPGSWVNVSMFAGVVVNKINAWLQEPYDWNGEFSIYRCNSTDMHNNPLILIKRVTC